MSSFEQPGYNPNPEGPPNPETTEASLLSQAEIEFQQIQDEIRVTSDLGELEVIAEGLNNNLQTAVAQEWDELAEAIRQQLAVLDRTLKIEQTEPAKVRPQAAVELRKAFGGKKLGIQKSSFSNWTSIPHAEARAIWGQFGGLTIEISYQLSQLDLTNIAVAHGKRSFQKGGQLLIEVTVTDDGQLSCPYAELSQLSQYPEAIQALQTLLKPLGLDTQLDSVLNAGQFDQDSMS